MTATLTEGACKRWTIDRKNLLADFIAAFTVGVASIPDSMASALLAGINPAGRAVYHDHRHPVRRVVYQLGDDAHLHHQRPIPGSGQLAGGDAAGGQTTGRLLAGADGWGDPDYPGPFEDGLPGALCAAFGDDRLPERGGAADHPGPAFATSPGLPASIPTGWSRRWTPP